MPRPAVATRERILRAAFTRFAGYGFRRTSMADIAEAAGVSRAARYLQFRNKEAIFLALAEELHGQSLTDVEAAVAGAATLPERLRAAVEAKTLRFVEIAYGSPHGASCWTSNRLCGNLAATAEQRFRTLLARVFRRAAAAGGSTSRASLTPAAAAELFTRSVSGLKGPGVTVETYRTRVAALVHVFAAGLEPRMAPTKARARS